VLFLYLKAVKDVTRARNGSDRSWRFARAAVKGPVVFHSAPGMLPLAREAGLAGVLQLKADDGGGKGFALYSIDLSL
jgi:2',3'-cyclic-nucleotide 2'-phosphodiesterase/3'-nucleotidase